MNCWVVKEIIGNHEWARLELGSIGSAQLEVQEFLSDTILKGGHKVSNKHLVVSSLRTKEGETNNFSKFWPWSMWPPSSPDLNPLDNAVWGAVERLACATPHLSKEALKAAVDQEWASMSEEFIQKSYRCFNPPD